MPQDTPVETPYEDDDPAPGSTFFERNRVKIVAFSVAIALFLALAGSRALGWW